MPGLPGRSPATHQRQRVTVTFAVALLVGSAVEVALTVTGTVGTLLGAV